MIKNDIQLDVEVCGDEIITINGGIEELSFSPSTGGFHTIPKATAISWFTITNYG